MRSTLDLAGDRGRLIVRGNVGGGALGHSAATIDFDGSLVAAAPWTNGRVELTGWNSSTGDRLHAGMNSFGAELRAHVVAGAGGIWGALGAHRTTGRRGPALAPTATLGGWMRKRGISLSAEVSQFRAPPSRGRVVREVDTLSRHRGSDDPIALLVLGADAAPVFPETTITPGAGPSPMPSCACRPDMVWGSAVLLSMHWAAGRVELTGTGAASVTSGVIAERWASAEATLWITPSIGVVAGGRRQRLEPGSGGSSGNSVSLGLRVASVRPMPHILPAVARPMPISFGVSARGARTVLEIRAPAARTVAIRGDFTGWEAIAATRTSQGWEVVLPLPEGMHQLLLRIDDGAWMPPPGLPTAPDGFGGVAGVIVIDR